MCTIVLLPLSHLRIATHVRHTTRMHSRQLGPASMTFFIMFLSENFRDKCSHPLSFPRILLNFFSRTLILPDLLSLSPSLPPFPSPLSLTATRFVAAREIHQRQCSAAAFHQWRRAMIVNRTAARGEFERQRECALRCFEAWKSETQVCVRDQR